jgi:sialic acid synthase SpsE/quercetin dioxygenase-like cupin family protein
MANNHQGDVAHGIKIIDAMGKIAREHGLNASVKLQYRQLDSFIHPNFRNNKEAKHISRFLSTELTPNQFFELVKAIKANGLTTICTPFDEESVDLIIDHGIEVIKVASCSADDWPLLQKIISTKKPIIASTGGLNMIQIDKLVSFLRHRDSNFAILHCVGIYPSPNNTLNLNFLNRLVKRYPEITIGYSGHEEPENTDVIKVAIAKGAKIFERHVGVPTDTITLNNYSMNPDQVEKWVQAAFITKEILGENEKVITKSEVDSLLSLKRGVYAKTDIKKGEIISADKVFFAMPCESGQLNSGEFGAIRFIAKATKDYKANAAIYETPTTDKYLKIREIIHDAKGMISEAGIVLTENANVELSHHYGLERFHEFGCLIVNLVNREYCKKIIVVFPGQNHPEQKHLQKEETFHILYGELVVCMNGIESILKPGDILTIERGDKHAFSSVKGCIIEEVSTTHFRNDSFYTDPLISEQDPMTRKTILEQF